MVSFQAIAHAIVSASDKELQAMQLYFLERSKAVTSSRVHVCEQTQPHQQ